MKRFGFTILILLFTVFTSCKIADRTSFYLDDYVSWAWPEDDISLDAAGRLHYHKMTDFTGNNLQKLTKSDNDYIWLKISFEIPDNLKNESLGFVIPYVHYADEAYFNGTYIGTYGQFPPNEYSAQYAAQFFSLPDDKVCRNGENEILIKVYSKGRAAISDRIFIDTYKNAKNKAELLDFFHSRIYLLFEGFIVFAIFSFLILSRSLTEDKKALRIFAQINCFTIVLLCYFFASEIPWYQNLGIPNIWLMKLFLCIPIYWLLYQIPTFILFFMDFGNNKKMHIIRLTNVLICSIITLAVPDYSSLIKICPWMLVICSFHVGTAIMLVIRGFFTPGKKQKDIFLIIGFLPVLLTMILDLILKNIFHDNDSPYFVLYGWFCTIFTFLFYSSHKYSTVFKQNEHLTRFLSDEVKRKTEDLTVANARLERELSIAEKDMNMAAIVQEKFYPQKEISFTGWDFAVYFDPMNKVSGDLYDYYYNGKTLLGIGLFDVSGHGVSASLVAMLAKNIIFRSFMHGRKHGETLSSTLERINTRLIEEKGQVQDYLTGLLVRIADFAEDGSCFVELSSAGHPYPIMYSAKEDKTILITHDEYQEQYGAIGIPMTAVSFPNVDLALVKGDVLVLFTDGLTEATNEAKQEFGKERIEKILMKNHKKSAKELVQIIHDSLYKHIGNAYRTDDVTFIVLKRV